MGHPPPQPLLDDAPGTPCHHCPAPPLTAALCTYTPPPLLHRVPVWLPPLSAILHACMAPGSLPAPPAVPCCTAPPPGAWAGSESQRIEEEPRDSGCCYCQSSGGNGSWAGAQQLQLSPFGPPVE